MIKSVQPMTYKLILAFGLQTLNARPTSVKKFCFLQVSMSGTHMMNKITKCVFIVTLLIKVSVKLCLNCKL